MMIRKERHLIAAVLIAIVLRFIFAVTYADLKKDYYWEYGELSKNIVNGKGYSLFYFQNDSLQQRFSPLKKPFPSAYMPPGYVAILTPFVMIANVPVRNILLIFFQSLCSIALIFLIYEFTKTHFTNVSANIAVYAAAIFPDFIYSIISFTPTILYQCNILLLMILLYKNNAATKKIFIGIVAVSVFLLYLRFEFFLFAFLLAVSWTFEKLRKQSILYFTCLILFLSPWVVRNYLVFDKIIPFTTSMGLNLYRGNNDDVIDTWGSKKIFGELLLLQHDEHFEITYNDLLLRNAVEYIVQHPKETIVHAKDKIISLWIINLHDKRSNHILLKIYSIALAILFFIGLYQSYNWKKHRFAYLFFLASTFIAISFFVLPRYQTTLRALIIPFAAFGTEKVWNILQSYSLIKKK